MEDTQQEKRDTETPGIYKRVKKYISKIISYPGGKNN